LVVRLGRIHGLDAAEQLSDVFEHDAGEGDEMEVCCDRSDRPILVFPAGERPCALQGLNYLGDPEYRDLAADIPRH
jgi:hypothetical protein